jgi:thymidine phosphorylase
MDALAVGVAAWRLGAGRSRQGEVVQAGAGIEIHAKPGEEIAKGSPLFTLHTETPERFPHALEALQGGWSIGEQASATLPLIVDRITA